MMKNYRLEISYFGKNYNGWQTQENGITIQGELEDKISIILKDKITLRGCGRTDAGVHALQHFSNFFSEKDIDIQSFMQHLNAFLSRDISVNDIQVVDEKFDSRFSAISREYIYKVSRRKNPFLKDLAYEFRAPLDIKTMREAGVFLRGRKDFSSFAKGDTSESGTLCEVTHVSLEETETILEIIIEANRFLRGMVRAIVGTLMEVGKHTISPSEFRDIIEAKNRKCAKASAPAKGLYLRKVRY